MSEQDPQWLSAIERQLLRKQAFDNEFEIEVAAQNNYTGADDMADVARYHGFDHLDGTRNLTLGGFYVPPEKDREIGTFEEPYWGVLKGMSTRIPVEVGTVNAVHNQATPQIWAHEYRHRDFNNSLFGEGTNRMMDFATALNQRQQDNALEMLQEHRNRGRKEPLKKSEVLFDALRHLNGPFSLWGDTAYRRMLELEWERGARSTPQGKAEDVYDYVDQRHDSAFFQKTFDEMKSYSDWNEGLSKRNLQRRIAALPVSTPMERQLAKKERRRLLREYEQAQ